MPSSGQTLRPLRHRLSRPTRSWQNRVLASRARLGVRPTVAETLPDPILFGDAEVGMAMVGGVWKALGHEMELGSGPIWAAQLPDPRLEEQRQNFLWLDDVAALGNKPSRHLAQAWVLDWIRRFGHGSGPGWRPETAGRRAKRWSAHAALLSDGLDRGASDTFWRGLATQRNYLAATWSREEPGLAQLRALAGLVWSGIVLPHSGHGAAVEALAEAADRFIGPDGDVPGRSPEELSETLILLIWTARMLENSGSVAPAAHLAALVRAVPVVRPLRLGDGSLACFHGGGPGDPTRLDQALAELRIGVQDKPKLPMGYARLAGGRVAVVMDAKAPPADSAPLRAHASTLGFEMSVQRNLLVVNSGPGHQFNKDWGLKSRQTSSHSTVVVGSESSADFRTTGMTARTFGAWMNAAPGMVTIRQAQDPGGQWLLANHDGYMDSCGVLCERRLFVDNRGEEVRGEDILTVTDARGKALFDQAQSVRPVPFAAHFHLHPAVQPDFDLVRQVVMLTLPTGEVWMFRAAGGALGIEDSVWLDPNAAGPVQSRQVVVRGELVEYLGQIIWSFSRVAKAPEQP